MPELTLKMSLKVAFIQYMYLYPLRSHRAVRRLPALLLGVMKMLKESTSI